MPRSTLRHVGQPNTSEVEYNSNGVVVRRRFFGSDGRAMKDIDYEAHHGHPAPHAHDWDWSESPPRQPGRELTQGEGF